MHITIVASDTAIGDTLYNYASLYSDRYQLSRTTPEDFQPTPDLQYCILYAPECSNDRFQQWQQQASSRAKWLWLGHHLPLPTGIGRIGEWLDSANKPTAQHWPLPGGWQFSPTAKTVHHSTAAPIELTEKESQLFAFLCQHVGETFSKETLLGQLWGYEESLNTRTVETHIYRLRSKLEPLFDHTLHGIITDEAGYRLIM